MKLEQLHEILRGYPGNYPLELTLGLADGSRVPCQCDDFRVAIVPRCRPASRNSWGPAISACAQPPGPATAVVHHDRWANTHRNECRCTVTLPFVCRLGGYVPLSLICQVFQIIINV